MVCTSKTELGEKVSVVFSGQNGSASFMLPKELAEYFTVGQHYQFSASHP